MMQIEQQQQQPQQQQNQLMVQNSGSLSFSSHLSKEDEEISKLALSTFRAKEEEIERKKMEVREKVQLQLGRVEEETKRLAVIREELEALADPMRKEVAQVRKKIDAVNKELKPLGNTCQKKLVSEREKLRMKKLEELSKNIDSIH
ncbi:structural maintenance of chromosomes protein 1A isoform X2 [Gossypium hirsutum]|uniref:Structural maintenance of chromosomes protein 1A isoform X2 n=1 Tax=Gossypium hirsutum TaxID=3635 RepID=A0A1U8LBB8_GOSHI|nr:structural maintenance of chromosomes protein 1A isoform X2 [Gossypium hirsutum]